MRLPNASAVLLGLILGSLAVPAPAQRSFQKFWADKYKKTELPAIVEDSNPPLDITKERYLFADPLRADLMPMTVFPAEVDKARDPATELARRAYIRGAITAESGGPSASLNSFAQAMEKDPQNVWLALRLIDASLQLNDLSRAERLCDDILKRDPENFRAMNRQGQIQLLRQKPDKAKDWYEKTLKVAPGNVEALSALASISYEIDRDLNATKDYSARILKVDDRNLNAILWNAEACAFTGEVSHAADLYERLVRYRPSLVERLSEIARRLAQMGQRDDALLLYQRAMIIDPSRPEPRLAWEKELSRDGGDEAVRKAYEKLVEDAKGDYDVWDLYAEYLLRNDDWEGLKALRERELKADPSNFNALKDMAFFYLRADDMKTAEEYFDRALQTNPSDADTYRTIADEYLRSHRTDKAIPLYGKALALKPDDVRSMQALALAYEFEGKTDESEKLLVKAAELSPADGNLLKRLGMLYLGKGDRAKASEYLQQVTVASPSDTQAWLALAQIYFEDGRDSSLDMLESQSDVALRGYPDFQQQYALLAQSFGRHERARVALEKVIRETPENLDARRLLAHSYTVLGQGDLAVNVMSGGKKFTEKSDELKLRWRELNAAVLLEAKHYSEAEIEYKSLLRQDPDNLEYHQFYMTSLSRQGKDEAVTTALNEATRRLGTARPLETQMLRAEILRIQGETGRALSILRQAQAENPDNALLMDRLASTAMDAGDDETAETYFRKLMTLGPPTKNEFYESAANNLGYMLLSKSNRLEEAARLIDEAHALNPNAPYIIDSMGWLAYTRGDFATARKHLERAVSLGGNDPEIMSHLGQTYEKLGEKDLARQSYEKALASDPNMKLARERRDALAVSTGTSKATP